MILLLALGGCLDRVLESPYVLAAGLGEVRSISPSLDGRLLVATGQGVYAVAGNGAAERVVEGAARAVTAHPQRVYVLRDDRVEWTGGTLATPGAVDILAGYGPLLVLYPTAIDAWDPATRTISHLVTGLHDARAVALGPAGGYLVVTADTLDLVGPEGTVRPLATGLVDARAAAIDSKERVYVAEGAPMELWRVDDGTLTRIARWLDDPRDLHFGVGGLLAPENTYIAGGTSGSLDYVRPPP